MRVMGMVMVRGNLDEVLLSLMRGWNGKLDYVGR